MQKLYALLFVIGIVLPLSQFLPWVATHGLDIPLLLTDATSRSIPAFGWADVLVTGVAVAVFVLVEGHRRRMPERWLALLMLVIGPSAALPLFLWLRERRLGTGTGNALHG